MMSVAQPFDAGIGVPLLGDQGLEAHLLITDHLLALADLSVQRLPAQRRELCLELSLFGLVLLIFFGGLRLSVQALQLALELFAQVGQALEVLVGAADAVLGFAATFLVLGYPGRLFDEVAQILRSRLDEPGDHALFDDRVAARAQPGAEEDVRDVAPAAFHAIEEIGVLRVTGHAAPDRNLGKGRIFPGQGAVGVIEDEFDARLSDRLARIRAVEDDVGHRLATQVLCGALAHDPTHGVDDVGLPTAVGTDDRRHVARKADRGRIDEGFETGEFDAFQTHGGLPGYRLAGWNRMDACGCMESERVVAIERKPRSLACACVSPAALAHRLSRTERRIAASSTGQRADRPRGSAPQPPVTLMKRTTCTCSSVRNSCFSGLSCKASTSA